MSKAIFTIIKGESERVKGKTFREFGGEPLYKRHLLEMLKTGYDVYVNTDSHPVKYGVTMDERLDAVAVLWRSHEHIAMEHNADSAGSPVLAMTKEFCDGCGSEYDTIITTHITSPFITMGEIWNAVDIMERGSFDSASSVTCHNEFAMYKGQPINYSTDVVQRTQDLEPVVFQNGGFYIFRREAFLSGGHRVSNNHAYIKLGFPESIEIDTEDDWRLAEAVQKGM